MSEGQLRQSWSTAARFAIAVLVVAALTAAFASAFRAALGLVLVRLGGASDIVQVMRGLPLPARVALPALGALCGGFLARLAARTPSADGVGAVMEAVVLGRVHLSMRSTLLKSSASWLAIVSGGSLGREGPLIQFGGASGKSVADLFRLPRHRARLIAAGTAAGFASAYNTPFAAALFVLEVVTGVVVIEDMVPVLVATVVASTITRSVVGDGPLYGQRTFFLHSYFELLAFVGLAVVAALSSQALMRFLAAGEHLFARSRLALPWRPALGGAIAGGLVALVPEVAGNGYEPLQSLLDGRLAVGFVLWLVLGKVLATASVGSGSPGGVFTPTLLVGGAIGFVYAELLRRAGVLLGPSGGYALVGMAAATAATTHAPLMAAVLAFELSGDYAIVLPLMITTALATIVSRALHPNSIYTAELAKRGVEWGPRRSVDRAEDG